MKKFVFKYKRWYFRLITIANLLIPIFLFTSEAKHIKGIDSEVCANISVGLIIATVGVALFLGCGLTYILQTFKTNNYIKQQVVLDKVHCKRLFMGIMWHAVTISIFTLMVTLKYCPGIQWNGFKYLIYSFTGITAIIGVISNSYIHLFDAKSYFQVFFYRHREHDVQEVMSNLTPPKPKVSVNAKAKQ